MNLFSLIFLIVVLLAMVISYFFLSGFRKFFKEHSDLLNLLTIVSVLSVFIQLYFTVYQYKSKLYSENQRQAAIIDNQSFSLIMEIKANLEVCNFILSNKKKYEAGSSVPQILFHFAIIEHNLMSGEITNPNPLKQIYQQRKSLLKNNDLHTTLFNSYHSMKLSNNIIQNALRLMHSQALIYQSKEVHSKTRYRIKNQMSLLLSESNSIKNYLEKSLLFLENFKKINLVNLRGKYAD